MAELSVLSTLSCDRSRWTEGRLAGSNCAENLRVASRTASLNLSEEELDEAIDGVGDACTFEVAAEGWGSVGLSAK